MAGVNVFLCRRARGWVTDRSYWCPLVSMCVVFFPGFIDLAPAAFDCVGSARGFSRPPSICPRGLRSGRGVGRVGSGAAQAPRDWEPDEPDADLARACG